ncbi:MAG: class I SAM-dependent methyltransferase [Candidatus Binatia bacterium]
MPAATEGAYLGGELDLFALAVNWKQYVKSAIGQFLVGDVLEVGAGIGGTTSALHDGSARRWICLEPDENQARRIREMAAERWGGAAPLVVVGSLRAFTERPAFDCVVYMDVLEHIEDDAGEVETAARLLRAGGRLVVLSPAHPWLFSAFDHQIGHLRRYTKTMLQALKPPDCVEEKLLYLDSLGLFLSLGNALLLRRSLPSRSQIAAWDRVFVPGSRVVDRMLGGRFGKSVLAVWRKASPGR